MAFRRLKTPALYNRSWCRINDVITLGGVMWHGENPVMDDSREKNSKWKEKEKYERVTDEHNERSSISLLYLLDVWNTHKHTHLSVRRQGTQREKRLILAHSFNQVICMSTMLWISCRLIFTTVFLAGEPLCCSRTKSQWTLWIFCSAKKPLSPPPVNCNNPTNPETIQLQSPPDVSLHSETWWKLMKSQRNHADAPPRL